ncbi:unnamed protein product [Paramecium sonneborni]|nr:unnamed protein product [Paramecium sonneborni]
MIFNKDNETNYPSIFINIYYDNRYDQFPIEQFQIRSDPQILLRNSTSYENELQIQICLKNDFNQICGNATLTSINKTKISNPILDEKFLE